MPSSYERPFDLETLTDVLRFTEQIHRDEGRIEAGRFVTVLKIYRWHLHRFDKHQAATPDELGTLKHGVRTAEIILAELKENCPIELEQWYAGCEPSNYAQRFSNHLSAIIAALSEEITANEALYPELKFAFDRERESYRQMKQDAEEAEWSPVKN
jgi:hypothetical protein